MAEQVNRPHRKSKDKTDKQGHPDGKNPKAYSFANPGRGLRESGRTHDIKEKRLHVPLVDRLPEDAPPLVVGVVGPPKVGKTTLIKSLIRRYTKQSLSSPTGPLTVVTSKRRRLTFVECPADSLASMIDVAKVVDIVLLMIDGKYGFEMETMEFLNVLSASGMPGNVFGILTKLDLFRKQDTLRAQKKRLKHRFWSELHQGAKLFYLSGVVNGRYPDREVLNLSRFLSVMKNPRPLVWRNSHPYCLADRFLDITPPLEMEKNPKCDRTIALYGYLRGTNFPANGASVHIPGIGDLGVAEIEVLPDPCPTPHMTQAIEKATGKSSRRRLGDKQRLLFAPMSDVGGVLVDKDAVYIDVKTSTFDRDAANPENLGLGEQLVMGLQGDRRPLGHDESGVRLFDDAGSVDDVNAGPEVDFANGDTRRAAALPNGYDSANDDSVYSSESDNDDGMDDGSSDEEILNGRKHQHNGEKALKNGVALRNSISEDRKVDGDVAFADSDSDMESVSSSGLERMNAEDDEDEEGFDNADGALHWKEGLAEKAAALHISRVPGRTGDLAKMMYDMSLSPKQVVAIWIGEDADTESPDEKWETEEEDFFKKRPGNNKEDDAEEDRMIPLYDYEQLEAKWKDAKNIEAIQHRFLSNRRGNKRGDGDGEADEEGEGAFGSEASDDEGDGAFEDLETGETHSASNAINAKATQEATLEAERAKNARKKELLKQRFEEEDREGFANDKANARRDQAEGAGSDFGEDEWYDAQKARMQTQLDINKSEFEGMDEQSRIRAEGYRAGSYARIVLSDVPYEFAAYFNPRFPLVIGGLNVTEKRFGFVQVRIKRHRWHQKILKTNDPVIFSLGWRRFQTLPIYSISDSRTRNRMLKYTPEHMHCFGTFYGPLIAPNTGFCCVQSLSNKNAGFRIAATGVVLSVDESADIVKKLKLKGYPHKVFKNTAIIKDMFGSDLEIAKFKAGNLRTVSGIRGMIKGTAGHQYPDGYARAGFEDKILMSDIVFLSTWRSIQPREFYTPVTNLLVAPAKRRQNSVRAGIDDDNDNETPEDVSGDGTTQPGTEDGDSTTWSGMRLTAEVRQALGVSTPHNADSTYRKVERATRHFNALRVPRRLQAALPFKSQVAAMAPQRGPTYLQRRAVVLGGDERRARDLLHKVMALRNDKAARRAAAQEKRRQPYRRKVADSAERKQERDKKERDEYWAKEGRKSAKRAGEAGAGRPAKKRKR